jgi:hypothetical protein
VICAPQGKVGWPERTRRIRESGAPAWRLAAEAAFFLGQLPRAPLEPMTGHDDRGRTRPTPDEQRSRTGLVYVHDVVGASKAIGLDRLGADGHRKRHPPSPPSSPRCRHIVGAEVLDFVSGRLEPIVDERHDPAHAARSRPRNLMCDEDAHALCGACGVVEGLQEQIDVGVE